MTDADLSPTPTVTDATADALLAQLQAALAVADALGLDRVAIDICSACDRLREMAGEVTRIPDPHDIPD